MKKQNGFKLVSLAILTVASSAAIASNPGAYVGGQLGWGTVHQGNYSKNTVTDSTAISDKTSDRGVAGRVFLGYQFNPVLAAELGYSKFSNATEKYTGYDDGGSVNTYSRRKTDAFDLVGKGILPLQNNFNVYGKLGLAYLRVTSSTNGIISDTNVHSSDDTHKIYPTFGAGVGYDLTENVVADLSWNRIQKVGHSSTLKSTDLIAVGLAYHFG